MTSELVGTKIQSYRILRLVGEGGMGKVYEAVHEQIDRRAAIKVLHAEYARDPEMAKRFFNEARAVNIIGHPGLVSIYELGKLDDGSAYIIMEYLEGESLRSRIQRRGSRMGLESLRIARQIAAAIHAAHSKNIVHRDLKPDNIIVVADSEVPGGERAKILDFGIAKLLKGSPAEGQARTRSGAVMGTPLYLAPEQCGGPHGVSDRTDVYALGIIMFEMLTGRPPFVGEEPTQLIGQHLFADPPPLLMPEGIPTEIGSLIRRMLEKDPQRRPTMQAIVNAVDRLSPSISQSLELAVPADLPSTGEDVTVPFHLVRSTLGMAAGQRRQRRAVFSAFVGAIFMVGAVIVGLRIFRNHEPKKLSHPSELRVAAPSPSPTTHNRILWLIHSTPPDAQVIRLSDGEVLGRTPWQLEQEASAGQVAVILRLAGYADAPLSLDCRQSLTRLERLVPISRPPPSKPSSASKNISRPPTKSNPVILPSRKVLSNDDIRFID